MYDRHANGDINFQVFDVDNIKKGVGWSGLVKLLKYNLRKAGVLHQVRFAVYDDIGYVWMSIFRFLLVNYNVDFGFPDIYMSSF